MNDNVIWISAWWLLIPLFIIYLPLCWVSWSEDHGPADHFVMGIGNGVAAVMILVGLLWLFNVTTGYSFGSR